MKKKASKEEKGGNGKAAKRQTATGAGDLLRMSDHLSGLIQKTEGPKAAAMWEAKCHAQAKELVKELEARIAKGEAAQTGTLMFKTAQMSREAGAMNEDKAIFSFYCAFVYMKDEERKAIPCQPDIKAKIDEICKSINPKSKKDMEMKGREIMRYQFASVLRHFGEYGLANLVLNDIETFNRRFREGALLFNANDPDVNLSDDFFKAVAL